MEKRPKIDPDLYDMACAWGLVPRPEKADDSRGQQSADCLEDHGQSVDQGTKVFPDGKKLRGKDLGAKGVLESEANRTGSIAHPRLSRR